MWPDQLVIANNRSAFWTYCNRVTDITIFEKHLESSLDHTPNWLSKFGDISFQEYIYVIKGISHPVFYGDLVYKLRRVKNTPNFISSGSKIVKRLRRRQYDPLIIERLYVLCLALLQPCTDLSLIIALWLTRRWGLYDAPCPNLRGDKVLIFVPSDC